MQPEPDDRPDRGYGERGLPCAAAWIHRSGEELQEEDFPAIMVEQHVAQSGEREPRALDMAVAAHQMVLDARCRQLLAPFEARDPGRRRDIQQLKRAIARQERPYHAVQVVEPVRLGGLEDSTR